MGNLKRYNYVFEVRVKPERVALELSDDKKYKDTRSIFREDFEVKKFFWGLIKIKLKFDEEAFEKKCVDTKMEMFKTYEANLNILDRMTEATNGLERIAKLKQTDDDDEIDLNTF